MADTQDQGRGSNYDQRGQHIHGPQYNADRIEINQSISPDVIAEGIRQSRRPQREPQHQARQKTRAEIEREQQERDLKVFGYRHYTRDRDRWLQTLSPQERWNEKRRASDRIKYGAPVARHHQRILRTGTLPADTSPADPRYLRAKRNLEHQQARRGRYMTVACIAFFVLFIIIAVSDGALWFIVLISLPAAIYVIARLPTMLRSRRSSRRRITP